MVISSRIVETFVTSFLWLLLSCSFSHGVQSDIDCLKSIKATLEDPLGVISSSWNFNNGTAEGFICKFTGVTCWHDDESTVLEIRLSNMGLKGSFPGGIQNCTSLTGLDLSVNEISGSIPSDISNLLEFTTSLNLSFNNLSGEIPVGLANCSHLNILQLDNNRLTGHIPPQLGLLERLRSFSVANNLLSGPVPRFVNASFSSESYANNPDLCGNPLDQCRASSRGQTEVIIGAAVGGVTVAALSIGIFIFFKGIKKKKKEVENEDVLRKDSFLRVSYQLLFKATDGFSSANLIGVGSFGSVYKGNLKPDNTIVAVKVLKLQRRGALKSFAAECNALRQAKHRNLVKVITACSSIGFQGNEFKALVYEYMSNGSLDKWLHPITEEDELLNLDFLQRLNISIDVACALEYLHNQCQPPIVHCDLKPSNILLDSDITAHVGDFGLAKLLIELTESTTINQSCSIGVRGTIGYAAPEYGVGGEVSTYGDIYSYGIMVLEMFTGKRPTDIMFEEGFNLHEMAKAALAEQVKDVVDPMILVTNSNRRRYLKEDRKLEHCLRLIIGIGVSCSMESPRQRMEIRVVVNDLQDIRNALLANKRGAV